MQGKEDRNEDRRGLLGRISLGAVTDEVLTAGIFHFPQRSSLVQQKREKSSAKSLNTGLR